jgi:hypothetical protein
VLCYFGVLLIMCCAILMCFLLCVVILTPLEQVILPIVMHVSKHSSLLPPSLKQPTKHRAFFPPQCANELVGIEARCRTWFGFSPVHHIYREKISTYKKTLEEPNMPLKCATKLQLHQCGKSWIKQVTQSTSMLSAIFLRWMARNEFNFELTKPTFRK